MKTIIINSPKHGIFKASVDDEDFDYLNQFHWMISNQNGFYYARRQFRSDKKTKCILMHREIMGITDPKILVDHGDHNTFNNQKYNLRTSTQSENGANRTSVKDRTSKYLGVFKHNEKNWRAQIRKNKKAKHLGLFKIEEDAARAYDKAAKELHGEFANLNFKA